MSTQDLERPDPARSRLALKSLPSSVRPGSFAFLVVAATLSYVLNALAIASTLGATLVHGARLGFLAAGMYVLSVQRAKAWLAVSLGTLVYVLDFMALRIDLRVLQESMNVAFLVWILVVVLREVFHPVTTERNAVMGALGGFLLILMIFAHVHGLVETLSPGAYGAADGAISAGTGAAQVAAFQYFSTVTMTTLGYGDIVPVTLAARLVTGLEAIVGQFYVAVVIAALVGRAAAGRVADRSP